MGVAIKERLVLGFVLVASRPVFLLLFRVALTLAFSLALIVSSLFVPLGGFEPFVFRFEGRICLRGHNMCRGSGRYLRGKA